MQRSRVDLRGSRGVGCGRGGDGAQPSSPVPVPYSFLADCAIWRLVRKKPKEISAGGKVFNVLGSGALDMQTLCHLLPTPLRTSLAAPARPC